MFGLGQQPWGWPKGELDTLMPFLPLPPSPHCTLGVRHPSLPLGMSRSALAIHPTAQWGQESVSCSCSTPSSACAGAEQAAPLWAAQGLTVPPMGLGC